MGPPSWAGRTALCRRCSAAAPSHHRPRSCDGGKRNRRCLVC
ncbi:hypothetical protein [Azospirillum argentinense]